MPLMLQSNAGIASQLLSMELYQLGLDYLQNYETLVNSVTEEIILETVKKYLNPEKLVIASSGTLSGEA
jgi:predicted Zn-dependent peptidase